MALLSHATGTCPSRPVRGCPIGQALHPKGHCAAHLRRRHDRLIPSGRTVASAPAGISCGKDCTQAYAAGTVVTLTATPRGAGTVRWSGACTGGPPTCTVTMTADARVTASFTRR